MDFQLSLSGNAERKKSSVLRLLLLLHRKNAPANIHICDMHEQEVMTCSSVTWAIIGHDQLWPQLVQLWQSSSFDCYQAACVQRPERFNKCPFWLFVTLVLACTWLLLLLAAAADDGWHGLWCVCSTLTLQVCVRLQKSLSKLHSLFARAGRWGK